MTEPNWKAVDHLFAEEMTEVVKLLDVTSTKPVLYRKGFSPAEGYYITIKFPAKGSQMACKLLEKYGWKREGKSKVHDFRERPSYSGYIFEYRYTKFLCGVNGV